MRKFSIDSFGLRTQYNSTGTRFEFFSLKKLEKQGFANIGRFPVSIKILLENLLRNEDGKIITRDQIEALLLHPYAAPGREVPLMPARVLLQDFTGVPVVVDLAAMRDAMKQLGGNPDRINPEVRADLVIDHSVQVDSWGKPEALQENEALEHHRNRERYSLLRWAQTAFRNFSVVPPGQGICHQVNLEYLAPVVQKVTEGNQELAFPDSVVGTDSHTTMINGLGVMGWGVGGIEAEAVLLGQPYYLAVPEVVGVRLTGSLPKGVMATDLVLRVTEMLRARNVVGKFVEFFGPGLPSLSLPDRATVANMSPEYGATMGFFPVDEKTLHYLTLTGREESHVRLVEAYTKEQGIFGSTEPEPLFSETLTFDLSELETSVAGPKRPQDRSSFRKMPKSFAASLRKPVAEWGFGLQGDSLERSVEVQLPQGNFQLSHGSVVIAAITSCTNTSNPSAMIAAGLLARNALGRGIHTRPWVKTSLAPGSRVVKDYLKKSGLLDSLDAQGFQIVGYGCTTCIGNSGPLPEPIERAIHDGDLVAAAVLSGNRNFQGRIHASVRANYLASPALVVAYALAGNVSIDLEREPLGRDEAGVPVFLTDIWPSDEEIAQTIAVTLGRSQFLREYSAVYKGSPAWEMLPVPTGSNFEWSADSTYIRHPPFFESFGIEVPPINDILGARVLVMVGDSTTTDHISPAGSIGRESPAGLYLTSRGIPPGEFNSYGSRRGNHEVMIRGTFANTRIRNKLVPGTAGGFTRVLPEGNVKTIWDAAEKYRGRGTPLIIIAGKEYGTGSSRDWAAKGTALLGVRAVIAGSFERIHRSNLIGMGVLPLQFPEGVNSESLGLTGEETFNFGGLSELLRDSRVIFTEVIRPDGSAVWIELVNRLDTPIEYEYYQNGGILPKVLRGMLAS